MKKEMNLNQETDFFSGKQVDEVVILIIKGNALLIPSMLNAKHSVFTYLEQVEKNDSVRVVLVKKAAQRDQLQEFLDFFGMVSKSKISKSTMGRMLRAYNQFMMMMMNSQKFFIYAHTGKSILQILNLSFAADYRIAKDNTVFFNPSVQQGLMAAAGGAYFLKKRLGTSKACEILLAINKLSANEALKLGLIDEVVHSDRFENVALQTAHRFGKQPATSLSLIKTLLNHDAEDLHDFLEKEAKALEVTFDRIKAFRLA
jgi:2-(1,2-epoxy-1,2-dihydrophenyl)acetyl-CoA isomerase